MFWSVPVLEQDLFFGLCLYLNRTFLICVFSRCLFVNRTCSLFRSEGSVPVVEQDFFDLRIVVLLPMRG